MREENAFERVIKEDRASAPPNSGAALCWNIFKGQSRPGRDQASSRARIRFEISTGIRDIQESDDPRTRRLYKDEPIKVYNFFSDEFFGIEKTIAQLVRYFHSASLKGEESRQVLYLMGPVGLGKSSLVERLQRGLEQAAPVYAIDGCPMHEEPLHLILRHLRKEFEKMLGVHIEGDSCPVCRYRLKEEFQLRYEEFPVETVSFSKRNRVGIGVVPPVDPNNQDTSVLIGSEDISKLDQYSEGDPRVLELNGALNVGNRGLVQFIEVFKNETEYLHAMITATQEKVIPAPGRHGMVYVDTCIVAHSNEAEWQKFKADHTNEAILDRIVVVKVPYNLRLSEEVKDGREDHSQFGFRCLRCAAHPGAGLDVRDPVAAGADLQGRPDDQAQALQRRGSGRERAGPRRSTCRSSKEDAKREGMSGISTRFIMKALDNALSDNVAGQLHQSDQCARSDNLDDQGGGPARRHPQAAPRISAGHAAQGIPGTARRRRSRAAFVYSYQEQAESLFQNYLDHAEAYVNKTKVRDRNTKEELTARRGFPEVD